MLDAENPAENPDATTAAQEEQSGAPPGDTGDTVSAAAEVQESEAAAETHHRGAEAPTQTSDEAAAEQVAAETITDQAQAPETGETHTEPASVGEPSGDVSPESVTEPEPAGETSGDESVDRDVAPTRKKAAKRTTATKATAKKTTKRAAKAAEGEVSGSEVASTGAGQGTDTPEGSGTGEASAPRDTAPSAKKAARKTSAKRAAKKAVARGSGEAAQGTAPEQAATTPEAPAAPQQPETGETTEEPAASEPAAPVPATALLFQPPDPAKAVVTRRRKATRPEGATVPQDGRAPATEDEERESPHKEAPQARGDRARESTEVPPAPEAEASIQPSEDAGRAEVEEEQAGERRRRRRGGRRRRRSGGAEENGFVEGAEDNDGAGQEASEQAAETEETEAPPTASRRRRRRRRSGESGEGNGEEDEQTVSRTRKPRNAEDEITAVTGSTRLEAKKQRRREGREAGRRRAPIVSEAEFLARRESVDRVMVIRQRRELTQIAVLEDKVLVEHYVSRESQTSLIGNVYLGRVQNVLPSMEAAFIDIGKGRNAVLYAGEVNWDALGAKNGSPRKIEQVLKSGQTVLVQVTKDPVGHKGARLTSQISLPGRFLVYVPDGTTSGISRKLPDTERNRLKNLLKEIVPDTAGVIVRTAAEGASEEELTRDVERLTARWADIEKKASSGNAPQLLYGEPDLTLKVVRDLFTEDFNKLVISGDDAWDMVEGYVSHVAPDLADRLERYAGERDVFAEYRLDEQIEKALDRKVWLPSGGSLVIDRTEAMTVVDVNTGKFTGAGGNLEETVTKNNLEAAEEIVRQLRLRDIGGIIVVDFIDMVLESNRDLVLRRLVECLGRDRTRHQVAEVTSLGLVEMTRKRIGTGLLEAFSESCEHCGGRGLILHHEPIEPKRKTDEESRRGRRGGRGRGREATGASANGGRGGGVPSPKDIAAMSKQEDRPEDRSEQKPAENKPEEEAPVDTVEGVTAEPAEHPIAEQTAGASEQTVTAGSTETPAPEGAADAEPPAGDGAASDGGEEGPAGPPQPAGAAEHAEAGEYAEGDEPAEPGESAQPADHGEPGEHAEPGGHADHAANAEHAEAGESAQHADHMEAGDHTEPAEHVEPAEPAGAAEHAQHAQPAEHFEPSESGEPAEPDPAQASPRPAPTVVTTVRRRSARRPAGPPSAGAGPLSSTASAATGGVAVGARGEDDPAGDDPTGDDRAGDDRAQDEPVDVDPIATILDGDAPSLDGSDPDDAGPDAQTTPHVPVKRRGSRRR